VIAWIEAGKPLAEYCRLPGKPALRTVYDWKEKDEAFAARFARARDIGYDIIAEDTAQLAESKPGVFIDAAGNERIDPGFVQWQRLRVDTRLKLLAKWSPAKYGDRQSVEHSGGVSINVITGVPEA
jgi:hypothetical protein